MMRKKMKLVAFLLAAALGGTTVLADVPVYAAQADSAANEDSNVEIDSAAETDAAGSGDSAASEDATGSGDSADETDSASTGGSAVEETLEITDCESEVWLPEPDSLADNEELFAEYVQQVFYGDTSLQLLGSYAASYLNTEAEEYAIYQMLKENIETVASSGGSTVFTYTLDPITATGSSTDECWEAVYEVVAETYDLGSIMDCLLVDCPYALYWYDKTSSGGVTNVKSYSGSYSVSNGVYTFNITCILTFSFAVATDYQGDSSTEVSESKAAAAGKAAENAQAVVDENASKTDYEKLEAYKEYICDAVSYNSEAASDSYDGGYGDPWQLIYVFDGDADTSVVCEGYSKAFQYLCDLSTFSGSVCSYLVDGTMSGGTGAGAHMWNLVTIGGSSYLADITNSDSGTIGQNGGLFLAGSADGSAAGGYVFEVGNSSITYVYSTDSAALYSSDLLTLSASDYVVSSDASGDETTETDSDENQEDGDSEDGGTSDGTEDDSTSGGNTEDSGTSDGTEDGSTSSGSTDDSGTSGDTEDGSTSSGSTDDSGTSEDTDSGSTDDSGTSGETDSGSTDDSGTSDGTEDDSSSDGSTEESGTSGETNGDDTSGDDSGADSTGDEETADGDTEDDDTSGGDTGEGSTEDDDTSGDDEEEEARTDISDLTVTLSKSSYTYNGSVQKPTVTVKDGSDTLTKGDDYTVTYASGCKDVGTYKVTIEGCGSYEGKVTKSFKITALKITSGTITLSTTTYKYSGSAKKPSTTVKVKVNGSTKTLKKGTDYTVSSYKNNTKIGKATVTIKLKGNYSGTLTKSFKIIPKTMSVKSAKSSAKKKLTVKWTKTSGSVSKYQIRYRVKGTKTWKTKTVSSSKSSVTLTGLKSGKTYQIQIRAYKTVSNVKYYGSWSGTKTAKVK